MKTLIKAAVKVFGLSLGLVLVVLVFSACGASARLRAQTSQSVSYQDPCGSMSLHGYRTHGTVANGHRVYCF